MKTYWLFFLLITSLSAFSQQNYFFKKVSSDHSGIHFNNKIETNEAKFVGYNYYGNSSGVGIGDFNNDGKADIFFSANATSFKLYLNQGNFVFKDVTDAAGVAGNGNWGTGVSIVDINGDGLPDIFVAHSGNYKFADSAKLSNELFINQGVDKNGTPHFKEMAAAYGLDLPGSQTTQVVFFDYDHDGDLDAFVLNHAKTPYIVLYDAAYFHQNPLKSCSNRLLRNDNGHFTDVTAQAGIIASNINFGLGVVVCDINNDGWPDIYCTSDFEERDNLYINQHDGTFKESLTASMTHISQFSMGVDVADINNDGMMDLMTLDMKPSSNARQKSIGSQDNDDKFKYVQKLGFYAQYARNMLHVNLGNDTSGTPHFSEIGQLAGVSATDWSWSPLFADFNNDGLKDIFVTSGYANNDNMDFKNRYISANISGENALRLNSKFFQNKDGKNFANVTDQWKAGEELMSYGAAYADFDNDGALDLVIANLNDEPTLLRNTGTKANYLSVKLKEKGLNSFAIGAKVIVQSGSLKQVQELQPVRGYESSQDYTLHFGMGKNVTADIKVMWPDGTVSELKQQPCNKIIEIDQQRITSKVTVENKQPRLYKQISIPGASTFISKQNDHPDFKYQFTLPYKVSDAGQVVAAGDINQDGLMDYYVGGEAGSERFLLLGTANGLFTKSDPGCFEANDDNKSAVFTDLDKDGKPDLVIVSRIARITQPQQYDKDINYVCRVYQNLGNGNFQEIKNAIHGLTTPVQVLAAGDLDKDGDMDIFIGGYVSPLTFGNAGQSFVFRNDSRPGQFVFTNITRNIFINPYLGMITSAEWKDIDSDSFPELFLAGEWMSCRLFKNNNGSLADISKNAGLTELRGLWSYISPADVNGDGHMDIIVGNTGRNNAFNVDRTHPMKLHMVRFNKNAPAHVPIVSCYYGNNLEYPIYYRDEMLSAVQPLRKIFVDYNSYANATMSDLLEISGAASDTTLSCNTLESGVFINDGHDHFTFSPFPEEAQVSRVNTVVQMQNKELLAAGNFFGFRTQFGMEDAMPLVLLTNASKKMGAKNPDETGLFSTGQVSKLFYYTFNKKERILVFRKNESPQLFEKNNP